MLYPPLSTHPLHNRLRADANIWKGCELVRQVARHRFRGDVAADKDVDFVCETGEVHRAQNGGVAAAEDDDTRITAGKSLRHCGAVVDPGAREVGDPMGFVLPVGHPRGRNDRTPDDLPFPIKLESLVTTIQGQSRDADGHKELSAKAHSLVPRPFGQLAATYTGREAEVVFDFRARPCLSSRPMSFE